MRSIAHKGTASQKYSDPGSGSGGSLKLELLSAMDIFRDLPPEKLEELINMSPMHNVGKGALIYSAEDQETLFLLKKGRVELYRLSSEGKKLTLAIVEQGTFLGEMSLIGQRNEGTYAVATEDSLVCAMTQGNLESLIVEYPVVALRIIQVLAARLQDTRNTLQGMIFNDVTSRTASLLLNLADADSNVLLSVLAEDVGQSGRQEYTARLLGNLSQLRLQGWNGLMGLEVADH